MNATSAEMNTQVFMPQPQNVARQSASKKSSFQDVMNQASKDATRENQMKEADQKDTVNKPDQENPVNKPQDEPVSEEKTTEPSGKEAMNLLMKQMAATFALPVIPLMATQQPQVTEMVPTAEAPQLNLNQVAEQVVTAQQPQILSETAPELASKLTVVQENPKQSTGSVKGMPVAPEEGQNQQAQPIVSKASNGATENSGKQNESGLMQEQPKTDVQQTKKGEEQSAPTLTAGEQQAMMKSEPLDLSKVNVKVGEAPLQADSPKFAQNLADKIVYQAQNGKTQFDLELNPGDLGTIRIKLIFESGKASVVMSCSNAKTESLLMGSAEQIRAIVQSQTGTDTTVHVKEETYQPQQDMEGRGENPNKQRQEEEQKNKDDNTVDAAVFLQQMKLGLVGKET